MKADLHIHSVNSDGVLTVKEIMKKAKENGLDIISITDHDSLDGVFEAIKDKPEKLMIIPGIEMSSYYNDESIHVLGYFSSLDNIDKLQLVLNTMKQSRIKRALEISRRLKEYFNITISEDLLLSVGSITRGHIARCIISSGYNYSKEEIFKKMIGDGCKAYIPATKLPTIQVISLLKEAGAIVVLAHPVLVKKSKIEDLLDLGFDGLEAIYAINKDNDTIMFKQLAKKHHLIITAGSDFHSFNDYKHGDIGSVSLSGYDLDKFLNKVGVKYEH